MGASHTWGPQILRFARAFFGTPSNFTYENLQAANRVLAQPAAARHLIIKETILSASGTDGLAVLDRFPLPEVKDVATEVFAGEYDGEIETDVTPNFFNSGRNTTPARAQGEARLVALYALARTGADDSLILRTTHAYALSDDPAIGTIRDRLLSVGDETGTANAGWTSQLTFNKFGAAARFRHNNP